MIHLTIDTKKCMSQLLLCDTFDHFSLSDGEITTFSKFHIDGYLHKEFFEDTPEQEYGLWSDYRNFCFSIIKGKRTPLHFKFIFALPAESMQEVLAAADSSVTMEQIQGLYLNFRFEDGVLTCTTGTALKVFTLDKSLEHALDNWIKVFFTKLGIEWQSA